jgi:leader peptidase (prepilin peptidase)/N-methyltransferase
MDATALLPREALIGFAGLLGLVVGSFLNVVIHRLPQGESLLHPGSHCPACAAPVRWFDNVPVFAWIWLRGRCRDCAAPISPRYPAIELLCGVLFAVIAWSYGPVLMTPVWWIFTAALIATAAIDFDHQIIPDEISLGGLAVALVVVPAVQVVSGGELAGALLRSGAGAVLGGGLFWLVGFLHARVSSALGREFEHWPGPGESPPRPASLDYWIWFPGVGFGDVKLLAMIGAVLGPAGVMQTLLVASIAGLALGFGWALLTRRWGAPFGFAPAIAVGALIVVLLPGTLPGS